MASTFGKLSTLSAVTLFALAASGCGRADIELYPDSPSPPDMLPPAMPAGGSMSQPSNPPPAEQCNAVVPAALFPALPPMGWNGYNTFGCTAALDEQKVRDTADVLLSSGMQAVGYRYVDLDDCWELPRSETGDIRVNDIKLPSGMAALGSRLHDDGFEFGVFRTSRDCPAMSAEHYVEDAATYAAWGVDLLKFVPCTAGVDGQPSVEHMATALRENGRPILLSLVDPPFSDWMPNVAQMSRTNASIKPTWASVLSTLDASAPLAPYSRPGAFNDLDMLEVGNGTLSESEQRSHFSLWSISSAPLLAGNDLTTMTDATRALLTNPEVIALDQDALGLQGALVRDDGSIQIFAKPLTGCGARGVVLLNRSETVVSTRLRWSEIWLDAGAASVRDLWAHRDLGSLEDELEVSVQPHDVRAIRVVGAEPATPRGEVSLGDLPWTYAANGFGPAEHNTSNGEEAAADGLPIQIGDQVYAHGLGVHAPSLVRFRLAGNCTHFSAQVGLDSEVSGKGSVVFQVWSDGEKLFDSGKLTGSSPAHSVDISLQGRQDLRLFVGALGSNGDDHADWAEPRLTCAD